MANASPGKLTRQQLYDRIRESSKDAYILEEMIRLGFWASEEERKKAQDIPVEELNRRRDDLQKQLRELYAKKRTFEDPEKALKEMHKQRMAEARQRREETKQRREQQRLQRHEQWMQRRDQEILYLGDGVSKELNKHDSDFQRLRTQTLPELNDAVSLARAMGISLSDLRFLSYHRKVSTVSHYRRFTIPKKTGGERLISAPMPRLKNAQYWILENILKPITVHDAAHGFINQRSIKSNANPHVGQPIVINMDLENFFPTIAYPRVKGMFKAMGYSRQIASILALLCTEPDIDQVDMDLREFFVAAGQRKLPQGAPTSPAITNIICRRLDKRLQGAVQNLGFEYTRYADDLTFSCNAGEENRLKKLLWIVKKIINEEGFTVNDKKSRIMRHAARKEVTGIVVNDKLSVARKTLKKFRALLYQIEKDGPTGKHWGHGGNLMRSIEGYANFIAMVDPEKGAGFVQQVRNIRNKW